MLEIRERFRLVQGALAADTGNLFKKEICSLQFRHICELIAIGCLAAQGDFKTQRAFREAYSPALIFNALRQIFGAFVPQPTTVSFVPATDTEPAQHHLEANNKPGAYGEKEVVELWNRCGNDLHRASVDKYLKATFGPPPSMEDVPKHLEGLVSLLDTHVIPIGSPGANVLLDVRMSDNEDNVIASFMTMDSAAGTISVETYRASLEGQ